MKAMNILYVLAIIAALIVICCVPYVDDVKKLRNVAILSNASIIAAYLTLLADGWNK